MSRAPDEGRKTASANRFALRKGGNHAKSLSVFNNMSETQDFRDRAIDCRALAKVARTEADRAMLEEIAAEFDAEAKKLEAVGSKLKDA